MTRRALVEAATEAFAEQGVFTASLVEITRRAGQRNRGAVHYHFGSREACSSPCSSSTPGSSPRARASCSPGADTPPTTTSASVLEAIVRPAVELAETGPSGRQYLVIVGELVEEFDRVDGEVDEALRRTGGYAVFELLEQRLPDLDEALRTERLALVTGFILRSVADRARAQQSDTRAAPSCRPSGSSRNLVAMAAGMATAPAVDA